MTLLYYHHNMSIRIVFTLLSLTFSTSVWANVDPESGSFNHRFYDFVDPGTQYSFTRIYKSQNYDKQSVFGKGWCSPIEDKLIIQSQSRIFLDSCEYGLVPFLKKKKKWMSTKGGLNFKRSTYFLSVGADVLVFNKSGRLEKIEKDRQVTLKLKYKKNKIEKLYILRSIYSFHYKGDNIVIKSGEDEVSSYVVSNGFLTSYINDWNNKYNAIYKDSGHLKLLTVNDQLVLELDYSSLNLVTSINNALAQCQWSIKYNHTDRLHYGAQVKKRCANRKTEVSSYIFKYRKVNGQYQLASVNYEGPDKNKVTRQLATNRESLKGKKGEMLIFKDKYQRTTKILNNSISIGFKYGKSHLAKPKRVTLTDTKNKKTVTFDYGYIKNGLVGKILKNGKPHLSIKYSVKGSIKKISKGDKSVHFIKNSDTYEYLEKDKRIKDLYSTHYGVSQILKDLKVATAPLEYGGTH